MNRKQLIVMWAAIGLIVFLCLVPPWIYYVPGTIKTVTGPYRFVLIGPPGPPKPKVMSQSEAMKAARGDEFKAKVMVEITKDLINGSRPWEYKAKIDWLRFIIPFPVVILLTCGLLITFRNRKLPSIHFSTGQKSHK